MSRVVAGSEPGASQVAHSCVLQRVCVPHLLAIGKGHTGESVRTQESRVPLRMCDGRQVQPTPSEEHHWQTEASRGV